MRFWGCLKFWDGCAATWQWARQAHQLRSAEPSQSSLYLDARGQLTYNPSCAIPTTRCALSNTLPNPLIPSTMTNLKVKPEAGHNQCFSAYAVQIPDPKQRRVTLKEDFWALLKD